jgi:DHA2 family multidrug resistance protein
MQIILDKGQRDDWFGSNFIRVFAILMAVGLVAAVIWELRSKDPVVDLRMLRDRNFALSTVSMFFLGFVLYASTVMLPQFMQILLGYTAETSGQALMPGGLVIMACMPLVGVLVSKVEARWLIACGSVIVAASLVVMSRWNLEIDFWTAARGRMLQGVGLAFLFIPINVAAFAFVPKDKTNMGTGIINLARNIGASVGIATVTTLLDRRPQVHQNFLVEHVNASNPAYQAMVSGMTHRLTAAGSSAAQAAAQSNGLVYRMIQRQSSLLAYVDNFRMLALIFLLLVPLMFLMKKSKPGGMLPVH